MNIKKEKCAQCGGEPEMRSSGIDLTEIRAKLWADVYSNAGIVLGSCPQEQADEAIKAFDERFKSKQ